MSELLLTIDCSYGNARICKCALLPVLNSLGSNFLLRGNLFYAVILLHYLLSIDELREIVVTTDSFNFWFNNNIIFNDFLHANVGLVLTVIGWADAMKVWSVFPRITVLGFEMLSASHFIQRVWRRIELFTGFHGADMLLFGSDFLRLLTFPLIRKLLNRRILLIQIRNDVLIGFYNCLFLLNGVH